MYDNNREVISLFFSIHNDQDWIRNKHRTSYNYPWKNYYQTKHSCSIWVELPIHWLLQHQRDPLLFVPRLRNDAENIFWRRQDKRRPLPTGEKELFWHARSFWRIKWIQWNTHTLKKDLRPQTSDLRSNLTEECEVGSIDCTKMMISNNWNWCGSVRIYCKCSSDICIFLWWRSYFNIAFIIHFSIFRLLISLSFVFLYLWYWNFGFLQ